MAYNLGELKAQVQLLTGHDNLGDRVATWLDRVCHEILVRAFWAHQMDRVLYFPGTGNVASGATASSPQNWYVTKGSVQNRQVLGVAALNAVLANATTITATGTVTVKNPVRRVGLQDVWGMHHGHTGGAVTSTYPQYYAPWFQLNTANTNARALILDYYPRYSGADITVNGGLQADVIVGLNGPSSDTDINWMLARYFNVVLAGVMRMVRLYLGDPQGYLLEKAEFENGIRDMLLREETMTPSAPVLHGVDTPLQDL